MNGCPAMRCRLQNVLRDVGVFDQAHGLENGRDARDQFAIEPIRMRGGVEFEMAGHRGRRRRHDKISLV
jgi:predicted nucleotidyltransferase component of viral defense system